MLKDKFKKKKVKEPITTGFFCYTFLSDFIYMKSSGKYTGRIFITPEDLQEKVVDFIKNQGFPNSPYFDNCIKKDDEGDYFIRISTPRRGWTITGIKGEKIDELDCGFVRVFVKLKLWGDDNKRPVRLYPYKFVMFEEEKKSLKLEDL